MPERRRTSRLRAFELGFASIVDPHVIRDEFRARSRHVQQGDPRPITPVRIVVEELGDATQEVIDPDRVFDSSP